MRRVEGDDGTLVRELDDNRGAVERPDHARVALAADFRNHMVRLRRQRPAYDRNACFDHTSLLARYRRQRSAELRLVIEGDRCNRRRQRGHDVRGIETATEADFEHGYVDLRTAKQLER